MRARANSLASEGNQTLDLCYKRRQLSIFRDPRGNGREPRAYRLNFGTLRGAFGRKLDLAQFREKGRALFFNHR